MTRIHAIVGIVVCTFILSLTASAGARGPGIPRDPNVVDIAGDANLLADVAPDQPTPVQVAEADILAAWLTNDARTITAHWHLSAAPSEGDGIQYILNGQTDSPDSNQRCLFFSAVFRKEDAGSRTYTALADVCVDPSFQLWINGRPEITELPDGTVILSAQFPRAYSKRLASGRLIDSPRAWTYYAHWINDSRPFSHPFDTTAVGRDYRIR